MGAIALGEDIEYPSHQLTLQPGEGLFLFTHGVLQAGNEQGTLFSREHLAATLRQSTDAPPAQVIRDVVRRLSSHSNDDTHLDDITVLALRYLGS